MNKQVLLSGIFMLLVAAGCSQNTPPKQEEQVKTVNVETQIVEPRHFERYLKLVGNVKAQNDVRISAEVSGRIQRYYIEQGDHIKKGEPILKIDDSQLKREQERLEAVTAQAKDNYERLKNLYQQDSVGSEMDYLNAKYNYQQNKASLEAVKVNIAKTTVKAPFDAMVENVMLEEGEMAVPGAVLVRLIGTNRLKISTGVPSTYSDVVNKGDMAQIWFDFQLADTLRLPITFVGNSISPQARTFEVEIKLPSESDDYKVDMLANVMIRTMSQENAIIVGKEYIYQNQEQNLVYTVDKNENGVLIARAKPVTLGPSYKNDVMITNGLQKGDRLITVGSSFLQDNMRINIVDESSGNIAQENS
ncbi:MAG TPA: efflux RND transporter periplasmic adaptor subunit [Balneolaceae bacterium]|nr:efflux RND transporter periplasmic adaptor subunit [Balneolaceae bacterium]